MTKTSANVVQQIRKAIRKRFSTTVSAAAAILFVSLAYAVEDKNAVSSAGLVLHYTFAEGHGDLVRDQSGHGNDARINGATWAKGKFGAAMRFDGKDDYLDCGVSPHFDGKKARTVALWFRGTQENVGVSLVDQSTGASWSNIRSVVGIRRSGFLFVILGDGTRRAGGTIGGTEENSWTHVALTFDEKGQDSYINGAMVANRPNLVKPDMKGVPLYIGRGQFTGSWKYYKGLIADVRIYDRALSTTEIMALYRSGSSGKGDSEHASWFIRPKLQVHPWPGPGKIGVDLDARGMLPLADGARFKVTLSRGDGPIEIEKIIVPGLTRQDYGGYPRLQERLITFEAHEVLDASKLESGEYQVESIVQGPDGVPIGESSSVSITWPGKSVSPRGVKVLNNLVMELLNVRPDGKEAEYVFLNPRKPKGWVFISSTANVVGAGKAAGKAEVMLSSGGEEERIALHQLGRPRRREVMRLLPKGQHRIRVRSEGAVQDLHLVIRSIPELQYCQYDFHPHIRPYGPYDWQFLSKDILPNINTIIARDNIMYNQDWRSDLQEWKKAGKKWLQMADLSHTSWSGRLGFQDPAMDGIIVDEFTGGGDASAYRAYCKTVEGIYANPRFIGKTFNPYCGTIYMKDYMAEFLNTCMVGGGYICWERYLNETSAPTEQDAWDLLQDWVANHMPLWEKAIPGSTEKMVVVLGYASNPVFTHSQDPTIDFKVFMDMQFRFLATHPAFFRLGGIQEYHSTRADEEYVRWAGRLFRHYCIEGNTQPLSNSPYKLTHIENPDFIDGTKGWNIKPAAKGSIMVKKDKDYGFCQERIGLGDTFIWTKRRAERPNVFSQQIEDLEPGKLYCLRMFTGDYQDFIKDKRIEEKHGISIKIKGVGEMPSKEVRQFPIFCGSGGFRSLGRKNPLIVNFHRRVFRAKARTAELEISDWSGDTEPGGPIAQEIAYNFIELQPYMED